MTDKQPPVWAVWGFNNACGELRRRGIAVPFFDPEDMRVAGNVIADAERKSRVSRGHDVEQFYKEPDHA